MKFSAKFKVSVSKSATSPSCKTLAVIQFETNDINEKMKIISPTFLLLITIFILTSFKKKNNILEIQNGKQNDSFTIKYHFDTTKYKIDKSGFYISQNKDIFQLNRLTYDDTNGIWTTHFWLDSLLFYPNYPYKKPLKLFIDLNTFTTDSLAYFEKDKNYVYFYNPSSDGVMRFVVKKADPKTFIGINDRWGKDVKHIFYQTEIVKDADIRTFNVMTDIDSATDRYYYYYKGKRLKKR